MHDVHSVLRVGVPQALFHHFFPRVLTHFRTNAPEIELDFFERDATLEKMMLDGALDAAISERSFAQAAITQHLIGSYRLSLIYPASWTEDQPPERDLSIFADRPFITYEPGQTIRTRTIDHLTQHFGHLPWIATTASGSTSVTRLVECGLGYAVVPEWSIDATSSTVRRIILHEVEPMRVFFAYSAFLESNRFIGELQASCHEVMTRTFRA